MWKPKKVLPEGLCKKCEGRGYTYIRPEIGVLCACDCENGKKIAREFDTKVEDLRSCRMLSKNS